MARQTVSLPYGFTLFSNANILTSAHHLFHYLMDLHYSQTASSFTACKTCFTTLWIYTILKPLCKRVFHSLVSLPYGFTLFSNIAEELTQTALVSLPYGFTLFSNDFETQKDPDRFHYLMDLHYSQTSNKLRPLYSAGQIHKI